jgi:hypothetical protein
MWGSLLWRHGCRTGPTATAGVLRLRAAAAAPARRLPSARAAGQQQQRRRLSAAPLAGLGLVKVVGAAAGKTFAKSVMFRRVAWLYRRRLRKKLQDMSPEERAAHRRLQSRRAALVGTVLLGGVGIYYVLHLDTLVVSGRTRFLATSPVGCARAECSDALHPPPLPPPEQEGPGRRSSSPLPLILRPAGRVRVRVGCVGCVGRVGRVGCVGRARRWRWRWRWRCPFPLLPSPPPSQEEEEEIGRAGFEQIREHAESQGTLIRNRHGQKGDLRVSRIMRRLVQAVQRSDDLPPETAALAFECIVRARHDIWVMHI